MSRLLPIGRLRLTAGAVALMAIAVGIWVLAADVLHQIESESETQVDNTQWVLSQFEMELLYLATATEGAALGTRSLDEVRLRFDIFYSRMQTVREGRVFAELRSTPGFFEDFAQLDTFLRDVVPLIDGPDAALTAGLHDIHLRASDLIETARDLALLGVRVSALESDQRRADVTQTLLWTGALTMILVTSLVAVLLLLWLQFRANRQRAVENMAMLSRLDAMVSTTMEALVTLDGQGRIVDLNAAACRAFGLERTAALGRDMAALCAPDPETEDPVPFRSGAAPVVMAGKGRFRLLARQESGPLFPAEVSIARILAGEGEVLSFVFLRDLSAQRAAEQALVAARDEALAGQMAKAKLLAVMSHEIRTPLNGMIGSIELLESTRLSAKQREYLRILQASGRLLMHHVNDVLDIARLESGRARPAAQPVDLAEVVREVIENQTPASRDNGNRLGCDLPPGGLWVLADGAQLRQVLLNLVGNAVKFTRGGSITVAVNRDAGSGETEISVTDTGIGIPEADLSRIFDDFVTLDASYARKVSGTGLGLGIVRRIVGQMGGRLTVDSREGQGSSFRISLTLPAAAPPQPQPAAASTAPAPAPPLRPPLAALVVEDNDFNRLLTRELLRQDGHDVTEARDGAEGIALAGARRFDVILMDISMPGIDGLHATSAIRSGGGPNAATPVIAMTAHALDEERARFRAGGMAVVLVKPVTRDTLRAALAGLPDVPPTAPPSLPEVIDPELLAALSHDLGPARAAALIDRFRAEAQATLAALQGALAGAGLTPALAREAHKLAGGAAMFGLPRLHGLLAQVERDWKAGSLAAPATLAQELHTTWSQSAAALDRLHSEDDRPQASSLR